LAYLDAARDRRGIWWDFYTRAGYSTEWVTAYVGAALATLGDDRATQLSHAVWNALRRRRWMAGGWGYSAPVPPDADSTLWALRLAEAIGQGRSRRAARAYRFLLRHVQANGGVATYAAAGPLRRYTRFLPGVSFEGWCGAQPCVTAAAALLPSFAAREQALAFLRRTQAADGSWPSIWWCDREVATALAAEALANSGQPDDAARVRSAVAWGRARLAPEGGVPTPLQPAGSPFASAWMVRLLTLGSDLEAVESTAHWLIGRQRPDGAWEPSAAMRIPHPSDTTPATYAGLAVVDGGGAGTLALDRRACFTTATVLAALSRAWSVGRWSDRDAF